MQFLNPTVYFLVISAGTTLAYHEDGGINRHNLKPRGAESEYEKTLYTSGQYQYEFADYPYGFHDYLEERDQSDNRDGFLVQAGDYHGVQLAGKLEERTLPKQAAPADGVHSIFKGSSKTDASAEMGSCKAKILKGLSGAKKAAAPPKHGAKLPKRALPDVNMQVYMNSVGTQKFPGTIGTEGLNGCTAIVLVGTGGAALGHFVCPGLEEIEKLHKSYIIADLGQGPPTLYIVVGYDAAKNEYPARNAMIVKEQAEKYLGVVAHIKHYSWARDDYAHSHFVHVDNLGNVQVGVDFDYRRIEDWGL